MITVMKICGKYNKREKEWQWSKCLKKKRSEAANNVKYTKREQRHGLSRCSSH